MCQEVEGRRSPRKSGMKDLQLEEGVKESRAVQARYQHTQHTIPDRHDPKGVSGQKDGPVYTPVTPPVTSDTLITGRSLLPILCTH